MLPEWFGRTEIGAKGTDTGWINIDVVGFDAQGNRVSRKETIPVTEYKIIKLMEYAQSYNLNILEEIVSTDSIPPLEEFLEQTYYFDRIDDRIPQAEKRTYRQVLNERQDTQLNDFQETIQPMIPIIDVENDKLIHQIGSKNVLTPGGHGQVWTDQLQMNLARFDSMDVGDKIVISTITNSDGPNNNFAPEHLAEMARKGYAIMMMAAERAPLDAKGGILGILKLEDGTEVLDLMELAQAETTNKVPEFKAQGLKTGRIGEQLFNTNNAAANLNVLIPFLKDLKKHFQESMGETEGTKFFNSLVTGDLMGNPKKKEGKEVIQLETVMGKAILKLHRWLEKNRTQDQDIEALFQKHNIDQLVHVLVVENENRTETFTPIKFAWDLGLYFFSDHFDLEVDLDNETMHMVNNRNGHLPGFGDMHKRYKKVENIIAALGTNVSMIDLDELNLPGEAQVYLPNAILRGEVTVDNKSGKPVSLYDYVGSDEVSEENARGELEESQLQLSQDGRIIIDNKRYVIEKDGHLRIVDNLFDQAMTTSKDPAIAVDLKTPVPTGQYQRTGEATVEDINPDMFRAYDYRNEGKPLTPDVVEAMGYYFAQSALEKARKAGIENRTVVIAKDARAIETELEDALVTALTNAGLNVKFIAVNRPNAVTQYSGAVQLLKPLMGIFLTASHLSRPKDQPVRGFKVAQMQEPGGAIISLSDVEIQNESKQAVYDFIQNPEKMDALNAETQGTVEGLDIDQDIVRLNVLFAKVAMERGSLYDLGQELYNAHNAQEAYAVLEKWEERYAHVQRPFEGLKVAIDGAHAGTGPIAKAIYEELGATVHDVNMDVEWVYGEHNADPAVQANRRELQNLIRETESDFGFTNDLDGDRLALELPYRLPTQPETRFSLVEPDSLMEFLLPPLMNQWGYGNVKTGIIRDVLGSSALDLKAGSLDMLMDQTDAGYPHLKRKKAEREKEYKARGEEIVFPIFGEKSGHIWTHFTGEMENPTATALLFTVLMAQAREQAQEMTRNEAYNVLEEGTITYSKSARVQPLFHPSLLQILSDAEFNNTGWEFNENPEEFKNPPSSLVKRGKDYTIRKLMEEFTVGKEFETAVGTLKVSAFNTKKDDEAVGGMYQFADINFEHQGEFVGRVIFRASSNDPTFVSAYEAVATEGRDVGLEFRNASMKTVYDFLRQEQLAIVTLDELALLPLTEKAKSNAVNKFNLEILAQDYKEASQAAGEDQAMVVGPDTDQRSVKVRVPGIYELVTQDNIIDTEDIWRLVTDSKGVRLLNQRRRFNKYKVFEKLVVPQLITDSAVPFNILVTPDRDVMIQAQDQRVHINTPFMGEIRRFDADGVAPEEVAATAAPQTRENIVIRPRDQMITIRTMEEKAIPPRTQEIAVLDKGTGQGQHIRLGNQAGPVQITVGERQWDLNITRSQREVQFTVTDDEGYSSGFQVLDITGREAEIGQQWKSDKLPFSIGVSGKADFHIRKDTSEPLLVSQSVETSASDAAMVVRDVVKKIEGLAPAEVQMLDLGEGIPKTIEGIRALIETIDQEKADTTLEDVAEVLSPSEIALWAAMVSQTTGMDVNAIEEQIRRIALESQGETTWDMDALLSESEIMFLAQRSLGDDITEDQAMTVSDIMRRDVESVIQEVTILERSDAQKRVGEYVDSLITSRGEQSEIIQSVGMLMEMLIQEEITFPDAEVSGPFLGLIQHLSPRIVAIGNDPNNKEVVVDVAKRKRKWSFQDDSVREAIARWVITHRQSQMLSEDAGQEKVTEMLRQAVEAFKIGPMKSVAFNPVDVLHLAFPGTLTDQQVMGWTQQIETLLQNDPSFATSRADPSGTYVYQGKEYGGINLDPNLLDLQIKRDGNGVPLPLTDQAIENMHIEGFIPVIINVTPITNLPLMLGFADGENPFASNTNPDEDHATPSLSFHVTRDPMDLKVKIENA
jgi:phosphomannomutase